MTHSQRQKKVHTRGEEGGYMKKGWLKELREEFPEFNRRRKPDDQRSD